MFRYCVRRLREDHFLEASSLQVNIVNWLLTNLTSVFDGLKSIPKLKEKPHPNNPHPTPPHRWIFLFSVESCLIFTKCSGYLPNHLKTWSMMSKMTPSSKSLIRNLQCPLRPQIRLSQPNHVGSSPNVQDIFPINYQHDLWCQRLSHPPSLQSGTLNVLQAPNLGFIRQIMSNIDQTFRIGPSAITNISLMFIFTQSFKYLVRSHQHPSNPLVIKSFFKLIFSWAKLVTLIFKI